MKNKIIFLILFFSGLATVILYYLDKNPLPILFLGLFAAFLIYALWNPPAKHKTFSYSDQQKATARALGGSGPPELEKPKRSKIIKRQK